LGLLVLSALGAVLGGFELSSILAVLLDSLSLLRVVVCSSSLFFVVVGGVPFFQVNAVGCVYVSSGRPFLPSLLLWVFALSLLL
jgi:hypothetical protein